MWVNVRHNLYIDGIEWKTIFKYSFNFSDIQFCDKNFSFYDIYIGASNHETNIEDYSDMKPQLNVGNDKLETGEKLVIKYSFIKSENLSFEEYDAFTRTVGYDEYSTLITRGNDYVTILTDYPIFCYCKTHSIWIWCHELEAYCSNNTSILIMFTVSKCSSEGPNKFLLPISALPTATISRGDSESETNDDFSHSGKTGGNSNSTAKLVTYASIAVGIIIIMIVIAEIFIKKQERNRQHGSSGTNQIIELGNVNDVSDNNNAQSSLLHEP
jgi:hypothetical protein